MSLFDQTDDNTDYLAELIGPGKKFDRTKYQSDEDMYKAIAKSNVHGSRMIDMQNNRTDEMRAELDKALTELKTKQKLEDYLSGIERKPDSTTNDTEVVKPVFDENKAADFFTKALQQVRAQEKEEANVALVEQKLREQLGDNANAIISERAKFLGLSADDLKFLAKKSPDAVINALGLQNQQKTYQGLPPSSVRTDGFKQQTDVRDAVYWDKMRRENPKDYFSEKLSVQRLKDMDNPDFMKRLNEQLNARTFP